MSDEIMEYIRKEAKANGNSPNASDYEILTAWLVMESEKISNAIENNNNRIKHAFWLLLSAIIVTFIFTLIFSY